MQVGHLRGMLQGATGAAAAAAAAAWCNAEPSLGLYEPSLQGQGSVTAALVPVHTKGHPGKAAQGGGTGEAGEPAQHWMRLLCV